MSKGRPKRKWPKKGPGQKKSARLNLMVEPWLKESMHSYASRNGRSISNIITDHFADLLKREAEPNVEQI